MIAERVVGLCMEKEEVVREKIKVGLGKGLNIGFDWVVWV